MSTNPSPATLNRLIEYFEGAVNNAGRWEMFPSNYPKLAGQLDMKEDTLRKYLTVLTSAGVIAKGTRKQREASGALVNYVVFVLKLPGARMERTDMGLQIAKQK